MSDPWVIEELLKKERQKKEPEEAGIQLPLEPPPPVPSPERPNRDDGETPGRGVHIEDIGGSSLSRFVVSYTL